MVSFIINEVNTSLINISSSVSYEKLARLQLLHGENVDIHKRTVDIERRARGMEGEGEGGLP